MPNSTTIRNNWMAYFAIFTSIVFLDQITKRAAFNEIGLNGSQEFIAGIINLTVVQNTGGAFSLFQEYPIYFKIIGIINIVIFSYLVFCPTISLNPFIKLGCTCILSGTVGNLIDRFIANGVIDFLELDFINFAIFNFADVFIDVGVVLILIGWYTSSRQLSKK